MKQILTIGELLWDIMPDQTVLGGAPANFSYRINRLGYTSHLLTRLGNDELGKKAFQQLSSQKINTDHIQWDNEHQTGIVKVFFDENRNPNYVIIPNVAYDYIEYTNGLASLSGKLDCIYFGTLVQRSPKTRNTLEKILQENPACLKFCDINLRKSCFCQETIIASLKQTNILKLNENEAYELNDILELDVKNLPDIVRKIVGLYSLDCCIVTLEEHGALLCDKKKSIQYSPGFEITLADPLGAGDAFSAGFLFKYMENGNLKDACEFGNVLGAIVATQTGATQPINGDLVEKFRQDGHARKIDARYENYLF